MYNFAEIKRNRKYTHFGILPLKNERKNTFTRKTKDKMLYFCKIKKKEYKQEMIIFCTISFYTSFLI